MVSVVKAQPTQKQINRAKQLRSENLPWSQVSLLIDASPYLLRCAVDPGYREHRRATIQRRRRLGIPPKQKQRLTVSIDGRPMGHAAIGDFGAVQVFIPQEVDAERDRVLQFEHSSPTAALMGDPPPWRSALGKK